MSFGQELKDFVTGMRHGYDMASNKRDKNREYDRAIINDEVENEAKKANTEKVLLGNKWYETIAKDELANNASLRAARAQQMEWAPRLNQSLLDSRKVDDYYKLTTPRTVSSKLPGELDDEAVPEDDPEEYLNLSSMTGAIPVPGVRRVQYAAEGGLIEEEEEDIQSALPMRAPRPTERPSTDAELSDASARANPRIVGFEKAHEAVLEGMKYSMAQMGMGNGAIQDPRQAQAMANYLKGAGAAPQSLIKQAEEAVDPNGELSESERTMGTLGTVYNHYIKQGDSEKAKKAAASIVQYQRRLFSTYASIAQAAAESGDMDKTVEAAIRAYASVPDGRDMKVQKTEDGRYQVEITDEATGEVVQKPVLTPQEIGAWALKVTPGSFDEYIAGAAGERKSPSRKFQEQAAGLDQGAIPTNEDMASMDLEEQREIRGRVKDMQENMPKPASLEQQTKARENINAQWDAMVGEVDEETGDPINPRLAAIKSGERNTITSAAADMVTNTKNRGENGNITETDALEIAGAVALTRDFQAQNEAGGKRITLPDERSFWMPMGHFKKLDAMWKRQDKVARDEQAEKTARANRDAVWAEQDRRDFDDVTRRMHQTGNTPSPFIPVDNGNQAALDKLNRLME